VGFWKDFYEEPGLVDKGYKSIPPIFRLEAVRKLLREVTVTYG
jgi:hypothetical protein